MPLALPSTRPPHPLLIDPVVRLALEEDLGRAGDLTSDLILSADVAGTARLIARDAGTICGLPVAARTFLLVDGTVSVLASAADGAQVDRGALLATIEGPTRALLT